MKQDIQVRKAAETDLECIERLYDDICDYLEAHKNYPGWRKGIYPARCDAEKGLAENALYIARIGEKAAGTIMLKHVPEESQASSSTAGCSKNTDRMRGFRLPF